MREILKKLCHEAALMKRQIMYARRCTKHKHFFQVIGFRLVIEIVLKLNSDMLTYILVYTDESQTLKQINDQQ